LHVFCEKPPGRDMNDIARVMQCKQQHPAQKLKYGFNHRYHDSVIEALRIIQSKELGDVINLVGIYGKSKIISFGQHSDWRTKREISGGGILLDQGIHMVDLLRLFAGEFKDVYSFVSNEFWHHDIEDNAYALMRTANGKVAMLHSSATQWRHRFRLDISLEKGAINLSGILSGSKSYGAEKLCIAWSSPEENGDPKEQTTRYNEDNSWAREITEFSDAIVYDKAILHGTVQDAYKTMELVYRIYAADKEWSKKWGISAQPEIELSHEL
jgi:predicted dehydrogenase